MINWCDPKDRLNTETQAYGSPWSCFPLLCDLRPPPCSHSLVSTKVPKTRHGSCSYQCKTPINAHLDVNRAQQMIAVSGQSVHWRKSVHQRVVRRGRHTEGRVSRWGERTSGQAFGGHLEAHPGFQDRCTARSGTTHTHTPGVHDNRRMLNPC